MLIDQSYLNWGFILWTLAAFPRVNVQIKAGRDGCQIKLEKGATENRGK